jgi:hypothetical protein
MVTVRNCLVVEIKRQNTSSIGLTTEVRIPAVEKDFSLNLRVQTDSEVHPVSCPMSTGVLSSGVKRPEREANHSPHLLPRSRRSRPIPPLRHTSSWGAFNKYQGQLYTDLQFLVIIPNEGQSPPTHCFIQPKTIFFQLILLQLTL